MTCTDESYEAMAEQGQSQEDINLLRLQVELARAEAKAEAYEGGFTLDQQQRAMDRAERQVRKEAHDRWHRKLEDAMREIDGLKREKIPVGHSHGLGAAHLDKLKKLGFE